MEKGTLDTIVDACNTVIDFVEAGSVVVDSAMSSTSENPVQNKVVKSYVDNSISGGIAALDVASVGGSGKYISAISEVDGKISATETSFGSIANNNAYPVTGGAVYTALNGKEDLENAVTWNISQDGTVSYTTA